MTRAAMQGAISASLNRGNILKDALQSVVTAGVANKVQLALHLHQYTLLANALTATANTAVGNVLHGGKFGQNLLANIVTNQLNMQGYSEILGQVANAIVAGIIKQQTPEQILQAWGLSTIGQIAGEYGAALSTQLRAPSPARLKIIPVSAPEPEVIVQPAAATEANKISNTKVADTPEAVNFEDFTDPRTKNIFFSASANQKILSDTNKAAVTPKIRGIYGFSKQAGCNIYCVDYITTNGKLIREMGRMPTEYNAVGFSRTKEVSFGNRALGFAVNALTFVTGTGNAYAADDRSITQGKRLDAKSEYLPRFFSGVVEGLGITGLFAAAATVPVLGPAIVTTGAVGTIGMVSNMAATFEQNNFMYTEDFDNIMQNPLISNQQKERIWDESFARQATARAETQNAKNILTLIQENPEATGFAISTMFAFKNGKFLYNFPKQFHTKYEIRSPLTFQFEAGKLYSGLPLDGIKFRNPLANKSITAKIKEQHSNHFNLRKSEKK